MSRSGPTIARAPYGPSTLLKNARDAFSCCGVCVASIAASSLLNVSRSAARVSFPRRARHRLRMKQVGDLLVVQVDHQHQREHHAQHRNEREHRRGEGNEISPLVVLAGKQIAARHLCTASATVTAAIIIVADNV